MKTENESALRHGLSGGGGIEGLQARRHSAALRVLHAAQEQKDAEEAAEEKRHAKEAQEKRYHDKGLIQCTKDADRAGVTYLLSVPTTNVNAFDDDEKTALMHAILAKQPTIIESLLRQPTLAINQVSLEGRSALHYAALMNDLTTLKALITKGGDGSIKDEAEETARDIAKQKKYLSVAGLLRRAEKQQSNAANLPSTLSDNSDLMARLFASQSENKEDNPADDPALFAGLESASQVGAPSVVSTLFASRDPEKIARALRERMEKVCPNITVKITQNKQTRQFQSLTIQWEKKDIDATLWEALKNTVTQLFPQCMKADPQEAKQWILEASVFDPSQVRHFNDVFSTHYSAQLSGKPTGDKLDTLLEIQLQGT